MRFFILFCSLHCVQAQFGVTTDQLFFRTTTIGAITFEKDKIEEFSNPRSIVECAIRCTQTSHCSRFLDDGNKCHLLQRPTFLQEVHENDSLLRVQEIQEWSHVMVLGGYITNGGAINEIEVLNMKTLQQCSHPFQLPERRFGAAAFLLNGRLNYALGQGYTKPTDTLQFDLRSRTWRTFDLETYPVVYSASAQISDSWVLLISGQNVSATTIVHANGTTVPGPPLPHHVFRHCAIGVDEDHIFVAGGVKDGIGRTKDTFVLKWSEQVWVPQDPLTLFHRSVTCETFLDGDNRLNILVGERHFEIFTWSTRKWRHGPDMLEDYMWGKLVRFDGKLYLFGGKDSLDERNAKIHVFDPIFETWTRVPLNLKTGRTSFGLLKIPPGLVDC